jgi:hypothetical protein
VKVQGREQVSRDYIQRTIFRKPRFRGARQPSWAPFLHQRPLIPNPCSLFPSSINHTLSIPMRLKAKIAAMRVSAGLGRCHRPIPASYNAESGARINRRTGFDKLVASRTVVQS